MFFGTEFPGGYCEPFAVRAADPFRRKRNRLEGKAFSFMLEEALPTAIQMIDDNDLTGLPVLIMNIVKEGKRELERSDRNYKKASDLQLQVHSIREDRYAVQNELTEVANRIVELESLLKSKYKVADINAALESHRKEKEAALAAQKKAKKIKK